MVVQLERGLWSAGKGAVGEGVDRGAEGKVRLVLGVINCPLFRESYRWPMSN